MTDPEEDYNYEPFAKTPEYKRINRIMVKEGINTMVANGVERVQGLLDIATGVGTMVRLFLDEIPDRWDMPEIVCLDQSHRALEQTKRKLKDRVTSIQLVHCAIEDLPDQSYDVDVTLWGNGIHYLNPENQKDALLKINRIFDPEWLFFNTSFYSEARPEQTLSFYRTQVRKAVRLLRSKDITREKNADSPEAANFHSKEHYLELVEQAGFVLEDVSEFSAPLYQEAWEQISSFTQYAKGALHGYPEEDAKESMKKAVNPAIEKHGQRDKEGKLYVPRRWLSVAARQGK
ncbi:MAG: class I SAM-dependent methyltransferase [Candidatus Bipolaricaulota bacterium]